MLLLYSSMLFPLLQAFPILLHMSQTKLCVIPTLHNLSYFMSLSLYTTLLPKKLRQENRASRYLPSYHSSFLVLHFCPCGFELPSGTISLPRDNFFLTYRLCAVKHIIFLYVKDLAIQLYK